MHPLFDFTSKITYQYFVVMLSVHIETQLYFYFSISIVVLSLIVALSTAYEYYSSINNRQCDSERTSSPEIKDTYNEKNILLQSVSSKSYHGGMDEISAFRRQRSSIE